MKNAQKQPHYDSHPGLLLDPDVEQRRIIRPVHTDPFHIAIVAGGAFFGTLARYGIGVLLPTSKTGWPTAIFTVNIVGAFALGLLLQVLRNHGSDTGRRRLIRLGFGTGVLGAFTTYSSLAVGADMLIREHRPILSLLYILTSVVGGMISAALGIQAATRHHTYRQRSSK
jgi:CrcB protein